MVTDQQIAAWNAKYDKPIGGIQKSDLAQSVQESLDDADSAYQKPSGGIPKSDLDSSVQNSLGKADTAIQEVTQIENAIADIEALIPAQASTSNQLADKDYVDGKAQAPVLTVMNIIADTTSAPTITGAANAGKQETIIYRNTGGQDVTVTVGVSGGSPVTPNGQSIVLACPAGSYVEVNYLNIGGTIYARGV